MVSSPDQTPGPVVRLHARTHFSRRASRGRSAFELAWGATLPAGRPVTLTGRSWSGATTLPRARDTAGRTQPLVTPFNDNGYVFDAVVRHPVTFG